MSITQTEYRQLFFEAEVQLQKTIAIANIAGRLVYASMQMTCSPSGNLGQVTFSLDPERAAELAEEIFNAAEARVMGVKA